jgi:phospholipid/cholesterol/gamma-HCH transport system substrate-binding protein
MNDRTLGYGVILFLTAFVMILLMYLSFQFLSPLHRRTIIYDTANTLSFLKRQDPVCYRGMKVGQIRRIFLKEGKTYVEIETRHALEIHQGYRIFAEAKGFMGDRYVEIDPGDMNAPPIDAEKPLSGFFPMGPTEAIAYTGVIEDKVRSLIVLTDELRNGSAEKTSLVSRLSAMAQKFDSISMMLTTTLRDADLLVVKNADTLASVLQKASVYSKKLNSSVPETIATIENIMVKTQRLLAAADSLTVSCTPLIDLLTGHASRTIDEKFSHLRKQIESLRNFINVVQEKGLTVPISL